jgi:hypothetical protein
MLILEIAALAFDLQPESTMETCSSEPHYNPARLLDALLAHFNLRRDSQLADKLGMTRPMICHLRAQRIPVGAALLIRMHETSGLSIRQLREIIGDRRKRFRGSYHIYSEDERISVVNGKVAVAS